MSVKIALFHLLFLLAGIVQAEGLTLEMDFSYVRGQNNSVQSIAGETTLLSRQSLLFTGQYGALSAKATLISERNETQDRFNRFELNELYWERSLGEWDLTLGKKIIDWGVGYGYRPLDLFGQQNRQSLAPEVVVGLPMVNAERFTDTGAWTFLCALGESDATDNDENRCAARYYQLLGDWDLQAVIYYDADRQLAVGGSFSGVVSDTTEWHGSVLLQSRYQNTEYRPQPRVVNQKHAAKALLGFTYTTESGYSLIGEVWHDGTAEKAINEPTNRMMLSLSYDGETTDPVADLLYSPGDDGIILTLKATTEITADSEVEYGIRTYQGDKSAFYRQLADRQLLFINFSGAF